MARAQRHINSNLANEMQMHERRLLHRISIQLAKKFEKAVFSVNVEAHSLESHRPARITFVFDNHPLMNAKTAIKSKCEKE